LLHEAEKHLRSFDQDQDEKRGRESFVDERGEIAIDAMIKCRVDLVYQLVVLRIMSLTGASVD
jgi:hypothetical protein